MPGTAGPRLGLVWGYAPGEVGWGVGGYNPNFAKLEALVHLTVIAVAAAPPATPANGDCYIVAASPTGAWVGHADDIAVYYTSGGWLYIDPAIGIRAYDRSGDGYVRFDGVDWIDEIVPAADVSGPAGAVDGNIAVFDATGKVVRDGGQALPTGLIVGTTDIQIIENKVIDGANNSLVVRLDSDVVGNLPIDNLGGGVGASNTTAWFGDGTWKPVTTGGGGSASITVSDTPPASPGGGQMWFDSASACLFIWYEDSSGGQWVVAVNVGSSAGGSAAGVLSISATGPLVASAPEGDVVLSLSTVPIGLGGTNSTSAPAALAALGAAPIDSPVFTGDARSVTPATADNDTSIATTAFVKAQGYATGGPYLPLAGGALTGPLAINPSAGGALVMTTPAGVACEAYYGITGGRQYSTGVNTSGSFFVYDSGSSFRLSLQTDGTNLVTGGSWASISDERLKRNIAVYRHGLTEICALRPITFSYAGSPFDTDGTKSIGLLAQDVEVVLPELVGEYYYDPAVRAESDEGSPTTEPMILKTLDNTRLVFALVNAIKELEARVRDLEERPPNIPEVSPA